jgi:cobalt-precorrin 5A hydrolase/precorrin-3B C17-methyltransferase
MAALAFECLDAGDIADAARSIEIVVAPGISAMQAAAARAGAPLGHDFCAISLSDLLTPWETIEARIRSAAEGDFVIAFYNPVSERRRTQLESAKRILLRHRSPDTPVVLARKLGRDGESVTTIRLADLEVDAVDMLTLVLVGASTTRMVSAAGRAWTYTPRGYEKTRPSPPATREHPSGFSQSGSREHPTSGRGRDGEGGKAQQQHPSPLPDPPPQGGRERRTSPHGGGETP